MGIDSRPTAQDYSDLFEVDRRGAAILEDLILRFTRPPVTDGGIDAVLKTYERMGQRRVIDFIVGQINQASGLAGEIE